MSAPIRVKICGITERADAITAITLGADALGFNFFPGSKRHIDFDANAAWIASLPPFVSRVAVLVNVPFDEARHIARHPAIDMVQLHGDEDREYCARLAGASYAFIKAMRIRAAADIPRAGEFSTPHILIDAHVPGTYGGSGAPIDLALAREMVQQHPDLHIILAGGLNPANVADAVHIVRPFAVDVASGVEREPRRKDAPLMAAFIEAARRGAAS